MAKNVFDEFRVMIEAKMRLVMDMIPEIATLGLEKDGEEFIPYTAAEDVREIYFSAFKQVGLSVRPVSGPSTQLVFSPNGRQFGIVGDYEITDTATGYTLTGWGAGVGDNGHWAANTAQTKAMKQFLLASFMANWKDPTRLSNQELIEKYGDQAEAILSRARGRSAGSAIMDRLMPTGKAKKKVKKTVKKTKKRKAGKKDGKRIAKPKRRSTGNRRNKKKSSGRTIKKSKRSRVQK